MKIQIGVRVTDDAYNSLADPVTLIVQQKSDLRIEKPTKIQIKKALLKILERFNSRIEDE